MNICGQQFEYNYLLNNVLQLQINAFGPGEIKQVQHRLLGPRKIVDLGCGSGDFTKQLALFYPDCSFLGIDNDTQKIKHAMLDTPKNVEFKVGDIVKDDLSYVKDVDAVIFRFVLQHLNYDELLKKIMQTLKDGAQIFAIEEFHPYWREWPYEGAYTEFIEKYYKFYQIHKSEMEAALKIPAVLINHGFKGLESNLVFAGNRCGKEKEFIEMVVKTAMLIRMILERVSPDDVDLITLEFVKRLESYMNEVWMKQQFLMASTVISAYK